ncbi:hypothetical protein [Bradyrhizobium sp. Leo121]|uniref:hypothetical protein n=1 Tax=Bradyrhizobium sp. Leo121 TaxID=1571195 RepID=UPI0013EF41CF|nr:hypothetical protein [Bradyrhizobium sp. Leo121]
MTLQIPKLVSVRIDWRAFAIIGATMPPRDPDDDEDEDEDEEEEDDDENRTDDPPVVREPDEG